jgi:hypothetical protein
VRDMDSPERTVSEGRVSRSIHFRTATASARLVIAFSCTSETFDLHVHDKGSFIGLVSKSCHGIILIVVLEIDLVDCTVTSS